jgi:hypothetical protein
VRADAFSTRLNVASNQPNDTTRMWWLDRSEAGCESVSGATARPTNKVSADAKLESRGTTTRFRNSLALRGAKPYRIPLRRQALCLLVQLQCELG